jgi:hypothetical protein
VATRRQVTPGRPEEGPRHDRPPPSQPACAGRTRDDPPRDPAAGQTVPELSTEEIERAVDGKYETFADSAVRDFVPVLVEKATRRWLAERACRGS